MKKKIAKYIREKFINPVLHSRAPVSEVSLGVAVGIFMGLTPTVGVQGGNLNPIVGETILVTLHTELIIYMIFVRN